MAKRIPFVAQTTAADCGAACLTMTLGLHGRCLALDDVRRVTGLCATASTRSGSWRRGSTSACGDGACSCARRRT